MCDVAFHLAVERLLISDRAAMRSFGVKCWVRYRDDIAIVSVDALGVQSLFARIRSILKHVWKLNIDKTSKHSTSFLDAEFYKDFTLGFGRLLVKPFAKASKVRIPLTRESGHPPFSHLWPIAECARFRALASKPLHAKQCIANLILDLSDHGLDATLLFRILSAANSPVAKLDRLLDHRVVSCVLPFHPIWIKQFDRVIRSVLEDFQEVLTHLRFGLAVKPCWKNTSPGLLTVLRSTQRL